MERSGAKRSGIGMGRLKRRRLFSLLCSLPHHHHLRHLGGADLAVHFRSESKESLFLFAPFG